MEQRGVRRRARRIPAGEPLGLTRDDPGRRRVDGRRLRRDRGRVRLSRDGSRPGARRARGGSRARARDGRRLRGGLRPRGRTWDLVLLCQTIDHLLDVSATVSSLARMVSPDGYAFIDVLDYLIIAQRRESIEGAVKVDHPYYLTRDGDRLLRPGRARRRGREADGGRAPRFRAAAGRPRDPDWDALARAAAHARAELSPLGAAVA